MGRSYVHLGLAERALIETQLRLGMKPGAIATGLMRARSTILREIRRNSWKCRRSGRIAARPGLPGVIGVLQLIGVPAYWPSSRAWSAGWSRATRSGSPWSVIFAGA